MRFTKEEFDIMVNELLFSTPISYKMLCSIADKTLKSTVNYWCSTEDCLRNGQYEDDIMNDIYLRLMIKTVDFFLLQDDIDAPYNNDPDGFEDWMFSVARNVKRDFANALRVRNFNTEDIDDPKFSNIPTGTEDPDQDHRIERLQQAFSIVLSSDLSVYKILTWFAQFVFILEYDITKIKSNELIIEVFENKTLFDMYDMILVASHKIKWLIITPEQNNKILKALRQKHNGGVIYGETAYKTFFMKNNGVVSGKKSISDWVNRVNDMIKRSSR